MFVVFIILETLFIIIITCCLITLITPYVMGHKYCITHVICNLQHQRSTFNYIFNMHLIRQPHTNIIHILYMHVRNNIFGNVGLVRVGFFTLMAQHTTEPHLQKTGSGCSGCECTAHADHAHGHSCVTQSKYVGHSAAARYPLY